MDELLEIARAFGIIFLVCYACAGVVWSGVRLLDWALDVWRDDL